jgi:cytochrome c oxidase assembly factor CtaG
VPSRGFCAGSTDNARVRRFGPLSGSFAGVLGALTVAALALPSAVWAHGLAPADPPTVTSLLFGWTFEPAILVPLIAAGFAWRWAVARVNRAHPSNHVPRLRSVAFYGGLVAVAFALDSGIDRYDTALFSVHMVQHLLLTLVAAPLFALSAPITLLLRLASAETRRRWILPVLHSRVARAVSFPVVSWVLFAAAMWGTHFSPLFDRALDDPVAHAFEHGIYLVAGLLFWWPAVGADPSPWRMSHPVRLMYVFLQMPQNTFLAVAVLNAAQPLYQHYVTIVRTWGPTSLDDQQIAAGIMWLFGDLGFLAAILGLVVAWMRHEEREAGRADRRADAELVAIREREARLAERIARGGAPKA